MAIAYNWINPHGGSWNDAANWNPSGGPQTAPAYLPADNATFATGSSRPYTVTGQGYGSQIVVSGDHVTFDHFQGFSSWTGGNLIVENGGLVRLQSGSSIVLLSHDGMGGGGPVVTDGTIISHGSIIGIGSQIGDGGRLIFSGPSASGFLGTLSITQGGLLRVLNGAEASTRQSTVEGRALVAGSGSQLHLYGTVDTDGFVTASHDGLLDIRGSELQGVARIAGGSIQADDLTIDPGGRIAGHGNISGSFTNNGVVAAQGGLLSVEGTVSGTGALVIGSRATLELGSDTSETIRFRGFDARLMLDHNIAAHGFLGGFSPGDSIDLAGTSVTSVGLKAFGQDTLLTAFDHNTIVATFDIGGHIPHGAIALSDDGAGGTLLTYGGCGAPVWNDLAQGSPQDPMQAFSQA